MKLPRWLFFWRPAIVQFRTGEYAIRVWIWIEGRFKFVDLNLAGGFSRSIKNEYFSDCLSNDLGEVVDKFKRVVSQKQKTKKEKEAKRYTIIIQSPR